MQYSFEKKEDWEFVRDGYNAHAVLVFCGDFFSEEKAKALRKLETCPREDLPLVRERYACICDIEKKLMQKVQVGQEKAEQSYRELSEEEN